VDLAEALRVNYLFRDLSESQKDRIIGIAQEKAYQGGDVMVRQFDKNSDLLVILTGTARIKSFSGETIAEVGAGSVVGEVSLVDDQPRSATVTASGAATAAVLPSDQLRGLMANDPAIKAHVMECVGKVLCQRLRNANIQLDGILPSKAGV
jgi:CRP-like cAMP-binding protein